MPDAQSAAIYFGHFTDVHEQRSVPHMSELLRICTVSCSRGHDKAEDRLVTIVHTTVHLVSTGFTSVHS